MTEKRRTGKKFFFVMFHEILPHSDILSPPYMKNTGDLKIAHLDWPGRMICSSSWQHEFAHSILLEESCMCETPRGFSHSV